MSKKILSLALVVVMLFSTFAIASSAALTTGQVGLRLETNATVGMPAGSDVWVKLYIDVPEGEEVNFAYNNLTIAWNSAVFTPASANAIKLNEAITMGDSYADIFKGTDTANHTTTAGAAALKKLTAEEAALGWDKAVQFQLTAPGGSYTTSTGFTVDSTFGEVLTMNFTTADVLDAGDVIGFPMGAYNTTQLKLQTMTRNDTSSKVLIDAANVVATNAVPEAAAVEYDVYNLGGKNGETAVKRANADGTYSIGTFFAFKAATIAPEFENGTSKNITGISATITATLAAGGTSTVNAETIKYVYDVSAAQDESELGFVVAINGITDMSLITSYEITPVMTTDDGNTYTCETITVNVADL